MKADELKKYWPSIKQALAKINVLDGVVTTGASASYNVTGSDWVKLTARFTGSATATVALEGSDDNTNWYSLGTTAATGSAVNGYIYKAERHHFIRANVTARSGGTIYVDLEAGHE